VIFVRPGVAINESELDVSYVRSSGPGGQNVNKTSTKAVVRWNVRSAPGLRDDVKARFLARFASRVTDAGDVLVTSDRYRDQPRNLEDCVTKLRAMLEEVAVAPVPRKPTRPGRAARERRITAKKTRGATKSLRGRIDYD
jgi:ribosome-associated protein